MKSTTFLCLSLIVGLSCSGPKNIESTPDQSDSTAATLPDQEIEILAPLPEAIPFPEPERVFPDAVHVPHIRTVLLFPEGSEVSPPLLTLSQEYTLRLQFDDLHGDRKNYKYRIIHCNADWTESMLMYSDYATGFEENFINDLDYSFNTTVPYTHYELRLPNEDVRFTKSGNYILQVFLDDPDQPIFHKRFMVLEELVNIEAQLKPSTILDDRNTHHEIDFTIEHSQHPIDNPYEGLHVVIQQNHRWDNAITDLKPLFIRNQELEYNYEGVNSFEAGNEFRYFDQKSVRFISDRVASFAYDSLHHVFLRPENHRAFKNYSTEYDANGRFAIRVQEGFEPELEADYVMTHFYLNYDRELIQGDVYVFGALTNWQCLPEAKMTYNFEKKRYEGSLLLKQGFYNYQYAVWAGPGNLIDYTYLEGSHFQTENAYTVWVYNRNLSEQYDRLVGMKQLNSGSIF